MPGASDDGYGRAGRRAPGAGRRLLLGWELGGGLGHATRLFVLAERLLGCDFDTLLALRPGSSGEEVFAPLLGNPGADRRPRGATAHCR